DDTAQGKWDGGYWVRYWAMIRILNNCINNFPTAAFESEAERSQLTAEARVLRAFYYLQMVKFYGDLPLIQDALGVTSSYEGMTRMPAWQLLQFCVSECEAALDCPELPWTINNTQLKNRMTKGIACAIMSQASLFAASPLFCKDQDLWSYAYEKNKKAYDLLKANGYELYNTLNNKTAYQNAYQEYFASRSYAGSKADDKETIWGSPLNWGVNHEAINGVPLWPETHQAGSCPTQEMVDAYDMLATGEPIYDLANPYVDEKHSDININTKSGYDPANPYVGRDPRFYASIIYNGSKVNTGVLNKTVEIWNNETTWDGQECSYAKGSGNAKVDMSAQRYTRTGYYNRKYHTYKVVPSNTSADEGNWKYYRLGEIYLNLAECAAETGKTGEAMTLVNEIRHRAGFDHKVDKKAGSKEEARLIVRHERQVELMFEEHRYFDCR
ncbi:MAG: RagB/SusD family nutrient uptake outer membrane protein, partial [Duncaniella sp.]|nr:RagB/SusD family nutrient uptake outer membrane protein [Duncaniella sp.]